MKEPAQKQNSMEVVAAVLVKDKKILIVQRGAGDTGAGLWEFPGGKREPSESREEALVREIREELSLEIEIKEFLGEQEFESKGRKFNLFVYHCPIVGGQLVLHEHQDFRWVSPDELREDGFSTPDIPFIEKVRAHFLTTDVK